MVKGAFHVVLARSVLQGNIREGINFKFLPFFVHISFIEFDVGVQ